MDSDEATALNKRYCDRKQELKEDFKPDDYNGMIAYITTLELRCEDLKKEIEELKANRVSVVPNDGMGSETFFSSEIPFVADKRKVVLGIGGHGNDV